MEKEKTKITASTTPTITTMTNIKRIKGNEKQWLMGDYVANSSDADDATEAAATLYAQPVRYTRSSFSVRTSCCGKIYVILTKGHVWMNDAKCVYYNLDSSPHTLIDAPVSTRLEMPYSAWTRVWVDCGYPVQTLHINILNEMASHTHTKKRPKRKIVTIKNGQVIIEYSHCRYLCVFYVSECALPFTHIWFA